MIKIRQAVVVEGKYDKIKLSGIIDAPIIQTDGFGIFKDKELQKMIRTLAERQGIIVLTDSDSAGFKIRSFIGSTVDNGKISTPIYPIFSARSGARPSRPRRANSALRACRSR